MLKGLFKPPDDTSAPLRPARVVPVDSAALEGCDPLAHCFDGAVDVAAEGGSFRAYHCGNLEAVRAARGTVLVLLHGAGQTALVWSHVCARLRERGITAVAYDARGHGGSQHADEADLSCARLRDDCVALVRALVLDHGCSVVLAGHSMGGAVASHAAKQLLTASAPIRGLLVLDIVEGTAVASMEHGLLVVNSRPTLFESPAQAVRWSVDANVLRSLDAARLSVPSQLVALPEGGYGWRTNLAASYRHWASWYQSLSSVFLSVTLPKMLMLAGTDRLDTALTVGQMQGGGGGGWRWRRCP